MTWHHFRGRRGILDRWSGKIAKRIGTSQVLSSSKIEEVPQNCFVFDVVKFKKLRKPRRIASFSSLQIDR